MTIQEQCRLSYYKKIADISTHQNIVLVQHVETMQVYVKKELNIYDRRIYEFLRVHPASCFPKVFECVEDNGKLIVIEEYIQGRSLEDHVRENGVLSVDEVKRYMIFCCNALKILHSQPAPIIHRDIKPSNLILTNDGRICLVDFNTARRYEESDTKDTVVIGTRNYAAPEQYGFRQSDVRTDIYAMGVMMNYLLTGQYPGEQLYQGEVTFVIEKCIRFEPSARYQSVDELRADLERKPGIRKKRLPFLPPGYRTLKPWKMILASVGYLLLFCFGMTIEYKNDEIPLTGAELWANRIGMLLIALLWIFFWFNYMDVHRFLPLLKKKWKWWNLAGYAVYTALILVIVIFILGVTALS